MKISFDPMELLNDEERNALHLRMQGCNHRTIADLTGYSYSHVSYVLKVARAKLGAKNEAQAVARYLGSPLADSQEGS
jgi:DNA-binding CsgD family transcriptional regulator